MSINPVGTLSYLNNFYKIYQKNVQPSFNPNQTSNVSSAKSDTLFLSEKAKDLAAKQAGKSFQEEQNETETARMKEMYQD
jgi:hypothetical protein